jgi:hypothetical protein
MATPLLTLKQFAALALGQGAPPWRCSKLFDEYGQKFLTLRSTIMNLSSTRALIYVAIRSAEDVAAQVAGAGDVTSRATLSTQNQAGDERFYSLWDILWSGMHPVKRTDLETLQALLMPTESAIVYLNPYMPLKGADFIPPWVTVGISGTFGGLASLRVRVFPFDPGLWTDDEWTSLADLKGGIVMIKAGGDYTSSAVENIVVPSGTIQEIAADAPPGIAPKNMFVLERGAPGG